MVKSAWIMLADLKSQAKTLAIQCSFAIIGAALLVVAASPYGPALSDGIRTTLTAFSIIAFAGFIWLSVSYARTSRHMQAFERAESQISKILKDSRSDDVIASLESLSVSWSQ